MRYPVYVSLSRDTEAAMAFLTRAVASTGVTLYAATTDRAATGFAGHKASPPE
jgi:hypothetical protein